MNLVYTIHIESIHYDQRITISGPIPIVLSVHAINYVYIFVSYAWLTFPIFHYFSAIKQYRCIYDIFVPFSKKLFKRIFVDIDGSKSWQFSHAKLIFKHIITKPRHNLLPVKSYLFIFWVSFQLFSENTSKLINISHFIVMYTKPIHRLGYNKISFILFSVTVKHEKNV